MRYLEGYNAWDNRSAEGFESSLGRYDFLCGGESVS